MERGRLLKYFEKLNLEAGVYCEPDTDHLDDFEKKYLDVRKAENRIYSDEELKTLPYLKNHFHRKEWQLRAKSFERVRAYFGKRAVGSVLDLGCGNGWFSNKLAETNILNVAALDVNFMELKQAARVFTRANLFFIRGNIFYADLPENFFNTVVLNASVQYFSDLPMLVNRLMKLLKTNGEIHFIDSPFYFLKDSEAAAQRTGKYYESLGFPEMASHYFHHTFDEIEEFNFDLLYTPVKQSRFILFKGKKDIPFPWIRIRK